MRPVILNLPLFTRNLTPTERALTCLDLARELLFGAKDALPRGKGGEAVHEAWLATLRAIEVVEAAE